MIKPLLFAFFVFFALLYGCGKQDNRTSVNKDDNTMQQTQQTENRQTEIQQTDNKQSNNKDDKKMNNNGEFKTVEIKTKGMSCSHCENSVKTEINKLSDIKEVTADANTNTVKVTFNPVKTDVKAIEKAIDEAGYEVVEVIQ